MALDPQMQSVLARIAKAALPQFHTVSAEQLEKFQRWVDGKWNEYLRRAGG